MDRSLSSAASSLKHASVSGVLAPVPEVLSNRTLLGQIVALSLPIMVEHVLHIAVGLTDTYMANHLPAHAAAGTAAVGTISYFLWFIGLIVTAVGTGSTAIIARAKGARHRSLANSVCGQSILTGMVLGLAVGMLVVVA
ncbi:MAG: MATE family efflux transporter, partial [Bacillota bacterium]